MIHWAFFVGLICGLILGVCLHLEITITEEEKNKGEKDENDY